MSMCMLRVAQRQQLPLLWPTFIVWSTTAVSQDVRVEALTETRDTSDLRAVPTSPSLGLQGLSATQRPRQIVRECASVVCDGQQIELEAWGDDAVRVTATPIGAPPPPDGYPSALLPVPLHVQELGQLLPDSTQATLPKV